MNINDFDKSLDNAMFIARVDNTFVMLYTSIMFGDLSRVDHKVSDKVMEKYRGFVDDLNSRNLRQMYDELNVKSTNIDSINYDESGNIIVHVTLVSRYMDYLMDKETGDIISGISDHRVEHVNKLTFFKRADAKSLGAARQCQNCGANMDINNSGKCSHCGSIFNMEDYDYVLVDIEVL